MQAVSRLITMWGMAIAFMGAAWAQGPVESEEPQLVGWDPLAECGAPSEHAQKRLQEAIRLVGYQGEAIEMCRSVHVSTAVAWSRLDGYKSHPYKNWEKYPVTKLVLTYNPMFMALVEATGNRRLLNAVLAHELGHVIKGHLSYKDVRGALDPSWERETEADYYVGFAMAKMGLSPIDLQEVVMTQFTMWSDINHPDTLKRLQSVVQGWAAGGGKPVDPNDLDTLRTIMIGETQLRW
ncbi:MAG: M48 family metalloprotease [Pseudomonadota bacterium]